MTEPIPPAEESPPSRPPLDPWEASTWEGHARWQLERTLAATPLERLLWLEAALELAWAAGAVTPRRPAASSPPEE